MDPIEPEVEVAHHPEPEAVHTTEVENAPAPELPPPPPPVNKKNWYVLKVQSNREDTIRQAIERRVKIEGLEEYYGRIVVPTERVMEQKKTRDGKMAQVAKHYKKYPGYLFVEVEFNDQMLILFRDTSGVGDFVGNKLNRVPMPMSNAEVDRILAEVEEKGKPVDQQKTRAKIVIKFAVGDNVKIQSGTFAGMEGVVKEIMEPRDDKGTPMIKVSVSIWGRPVEVDADPLSVEAV